MNIPNPLYVMKISLLGFRVWELFEHISYRISFISCVREFLWESVSLSQSYTPKLKVTVEAGKLASILPSNLQSSMMGCTTKTLNPSNPWLSMVGCTPKTPIMLGQYRKNRASGEVFLEALTLKTFSTWMPMGLSNYLRLGLEAYFYSP